MMKCPGCDFETSDISDFRFLYHSRLDSPISMRQCPKCFHTLAIDDITCEVVQEVKPGDAPWGKSDADYDSKMKSK